VGLEGVGLEGAGLEGVGLEGVGLEGVGHTECSGFKLQKLFLCVVTSSLENNPSVQKFND